MSWSGQNLTAIANRFLAVFNNNTFKSWESFAELTKELGHIFREEGISVDRIQFPLTKYNGFLHPTIGTALFTWTSANDQVEQEIMTHDLLVTETGEDFYRQRLRKTPYYKLIFEGKGVVHYPLSGDIEGIEVLPKLKANGYTDYFAFKVVMANGKNQCISFATKHAEGFDKKRFLKIFALLKPVLTLSLLTAYQISLAVEIANTYIGKRTAKRVLAGQIIRGSSTHLQAGIMFCDLRGFTKLNDTLGAEATVVLMNQVFEKVGDVLAQFPTEILKFIGDAMLILLPVEDFSSKAEMQEVMHSIAMESSEEINVLAKDLNKDLSLGFGGNIGEVYYGNVGTGTRLDFTVMGPAVNKAARLESLCSKLNSHYVVSSEAYFGEANFIDHGMQSLKGIEQRQQIYGLSFIAREPR